jgi:hypothetical protein
MEIRLLKADEIECRVQSVKKTSKSVGCILLLYKDARVDMKLLDEIYGSMNWQRTHEVINGNLFCNIEVWDKDKGCWVKKQDVGVESNTEKEKGQASDSFKRSGFNWGIGRELYTSPFIWVELKDGEYSEKDGKCSLNANVKFEVKSIGYNSEREIIALQIKDNHNIVRFDMGKRPPEVLEGDKPSGNVNNAHNSDKPAKNENTQSGKATKAQVDELTALAKSEKGLEKETYWDYLRKLKDEGKISTQYPLSRDKQVQWAIADYEYIKNDLLCPF